MVSSYGLNSECNINSGEHLENQNMHDNVYTSFDNLMMFMSFPKLIFTSLQRKGKLDSNKHMKNRTVWLEQMKNNA